MSAKSNYPIQIYILAAVTTAGLIALFLAANAAFLLVSVNPWQAFFNALLIEAGLVAESIALVKHPKSTLTYVGITISLTVSGTYNYIQSAEQASEMIGSLELIALAVGPLAALFFISLILGKEIRTHQNTIDESLKAISEKESAIEAENRQWERSIQREKMLAEIAAKKEAEIARAEAEKEAAIVAAKQKASVERAKTRAATRKVLPETRKVLPEARKVSPETNGKLPEIKSLSHFKELIENGELDASKLTGNILYEVGAVNTPRTGRNWIKAVKGE